MKTTDTEKIKTKEEARDLAIRWQAWQSKRALSWGEVIKWSHAFAVLARKFHLVREFKENGVI